MQAFTVALVVGFTLSEVMALGGLRLGERMIDRPLLRRVGAKSHASKMRSLETVWPMTRIRPALQRGDVTTVVTVITSLVALKSVASLLFGLLAIFWLPLASLIVPTIVAAEDPDDAELRLWVQAVARLQVTSHVAAAALGFAVTVTGPLAGHSVESVIRANLWSTVAAVALSAGCAVAAGRREALGLVKRGI